MNDGNVSIRIDLDTKSFDVQIENAEEELKKLEKAYTDTANMPTFKGQEEDLKELRTEIEKTANKIVSLRDAQRRASEEELVPENKINLMEKLTKGAKKLAFGILGIRTAYTVIRRMSSAYLSTDEHTTQQLSANWTALGTLMGSVIRYISTIMKKLVTSILYFASTLTGVNYIEKANTAILKNQTKATQALTSANNKLNTSFDEMETLNDTSASADVSSGVDMTTLFDISDIGEKARNTIEKLGIALKPVYETIKSIVDFAIDHPDILISMLGSVAVLKMLGSLIGVAGAVGGASAGAGATGLAGVASLLSYIAGIGVIAIEIYMVYSTVKEAQEASEKLNEEIDKLGNQSDKLNKTRKQVIKTGRATKEWVQNTTRAIKDDNTALRNNTNEILKNREEMSPFEKMISKLTGQWEADSNQIKTNNEIMKDNLDVMGMMYDQGLLNEQQKKDYIQALKNYQDGLKGVIQDQMDLNTTDKNSNEILKNTQTELEKTKNRLNEVSGASNDNKTAFSNAITKASEYINTLAGIKPSVTTKVDFETTSARDKLNNLFSNISLKLESWGIKFPKIHLAQGGIVNNPGRGVALGSNVIAGENGAEAVLPLTDDTMQRIANMIPITVHVVNTMNGRVISRELQKVKNEGDFAGNK